MKPQIIGLRTVWKKTLYCTHPFHTLRNNNQPEKISKDVFSKKKCGNQGGTKCRWLISYEKTPIIEDLTRRHGPKPPSRQQLVDALIKRDSTIKNLVVEISQLRSELTELKNRNNKMFLKLKMYVSSYGDLK